MLKRENSTTTLLLLTFSLSLSAERSRHESLATRKLSSCAAHLSWWSTGNIYWTWIVIVEAGYLVSLFSFPLYLVLFLPCFYETNKKRPVRSWMPIVEADNDRGSKCQRLGIKLVLDLLWIHFWFLFLLLKYISAFLLYVHIKDEDVGIVYQDKETMAAVLVNHDAEDDALILVIPAILIFLLLRFYFIFHLNKKIRWCPLFPPRWHIYVSVLLCLARDCVGWRSSIANIVLDVASSRYYCAHRTKKIETSPRVGKRKEVVAGRNFGHEWDLELPMWKCTRNALSYFPPDFFVFCWENEKTWWSRRRIEIRRKQTERKW